MKGWHPLKFQPLYQERVWGGNRLGGLFDRRLPGDVRIGESWEICDRPGASSVVSEGGLAGRTLGELMAEDSLGLWGEGAVSGMRFPWLCKLLDAREDLSLQVHPPERIAGSMGGEAKSELWYVADADAGSFVHVGLQPGTTPDELAKRARDGTVAGLFHHLPVKAGDALFIPSGRVHALGRGVVVLEIQQNSDTTFRVFDWNRPGLDGRPRPLHLAQALASMDFSDTAPSLAGGVWVEEAGARVRSLLRHELFCIDEVEGRGGRVERGGLGAWVVAVVQGCVEVSGGGVTVAARRGDFVLVPAALGGARLDAGDGAVWLRTTRGGVMNR